MTASVCAAEGMRTAIAPTRTSPAEPAFLGARLDAYFSERLRLHGGRNPLVGRPPGPGDLVLQSNDYLCMGDHPRVAAARRRAAGYAGAQPVMSAVFLGEGTVQDRFEREIAGFLDAPAALLGQSGWNVNVGALQALAGPDTPVYVDRMAHMSLWEGVRSAGAVPVPFRHNRPEHLERRILRHGPGIIVCDSVYSTSGAEAPLADLATLAERQGCLLVVDESHSLGTHGPGGAGLVVALGLEDRVHLRTASLAKAFAGRGGIVAGSARLIEFLRYQAHPAIFSSGLLDPEIEVFRATLATLRTAGDARRRLREHAARVREGLLDLGYDVRASASQIFGLVAGPEPEAVRLRDALEARGVLGSLFLPPATPAKRALVRLSLHSELESGQIDQLLRVCADVRGPAGMARWSSRRRLLALRVAERIAGPEDPDTPTVPAPVPAAAGVLHAAAVAAPAAGPAAPPRAAASVPRSLELQEVAS